MSLKMTSWNFLDNLWLLSVLRIQGLQPSKLSSMLFLSVAYFTGKQLTTCPVLADLRSWPVYLPPHFLECVSVRADIHCKATLGLTDISSRITLRYEASLTLPCIVSGAVRESMNTTACYVLLALHSH